MKRMRLLAPAALVAAVGLAPVTAAADLPVAPAAPAATVVSAVPVSPVRSEGPAGQAVPAGPEARVRSEAPVGQAAPRGASRPLSTASGMAALEGGGFWGSVACFSCLGAALGTSVVLPVTRIFLGPCLSLCKALL